MQVTETKAEGLKREYKLVVTAEALDAKTTEKLEVLRKDIHLKGFRKGKAPLNLMKQRFGKSVLGEVVQETVENSVADHLKEQGHRPAKLVAAGPQAMDALLAANPDGDRPRATRPRRAAQFLKLLRSHVRADVRAHLAQVLDEGGLEAFVTRELPMLNAFVGDAWAGGELQVHEEHMYSDCLQDILRPAIAAASTTFGRIGSVRRRQTPTKPVGE